MRYRCSWLAGLNGQGRGNTRQLCLLLRGYMCYPYLQEHKLEVQEAIALPSGLLRATMLTQASWGAGDEVRALLAVYLWGPGPGASHTVPAAPANNVPNSHMCTLHNTHPVNTLLSEEAYPGWAPRAPSCGERDGRPMGHTGRKSFACL